MKRLTSVLVSIGLTTIVNAYAALPAAKDPSLINVPQLPGGFTIGIAGAYLETAPTNNILDLGVVNIIPSPNIPFLFSGVVNMTTIRSWAWGINLGYIFPQTGNDINIDYFHLQTGNNTLIAGIPFPNSISPISFNPGINLLDQSTANILYRIKQVDLTAGQFINIGSRLSLHPNAGLRYADLKREHDEVFSGASQFQIGNTISNQVLIIGMNEDSDFSGVGPILGLDASYYVDMGFGFVGHVNGALLVGNTKSQNNVDIIDDITSTPIGGSATAVQLGGNYVFKADSDARIVPVLDLKLGGDYTYLFHNAANSNLTIEGGYQVSQYFNPIGRLTTFVNVAGEQGSIIAHSTGDLTINGPYASLTLHI